MQQFPGLEKIEGLVNYMEKPNDADKHKPLAHIALNPVSSTIFALIPLWASIINSSDDEEINSLNFIELPI